MFLKDCRTIKRITYTRVTKNKDKLSKDTSMCTTGRHGDGSYYYMNEFTEVPNEFGLVNQEIVKRLFSNVYQNFKKNMEQFEKQVLHNRDQQDTYRISYKDSENQMQHKTFTFINSKYNPITWFNDLVFNYSSYRSNIKNDSHPFYGNSPELINIEELRNEIKRGCIPFSRFFNARTEYLVDNFADDTFCSYIINNDGSIIIRESNPYVNYDERIKINNRGYIEKCDKNYPYVQALKKFNVRIVNYLYKDT